MIPYGKQDISTADIAAVEKVLKSDFLTQGPCVPKFEQIVCKQVGAKYGVAVNSATSALHIACLALGVGEGDIVWTTPISFVASANCALYCGAMVDFVDIDSTTFNMCPQALEEKLIDAKKTGNLPKVVIPVHLCGQPCNMAKIHFLAKEYGFFIIEDASHAIGASFDNVPIGKCNHSDICIFSFHPVKIITTAEGGLATTNNERLAIKMNLFRSHGVTRNPDMMQNKTHGPWYYQQIELGYNYRMTEMQAALGISQMDRLTDFIADRRKLAVRYDNLLKELPVSTPRQLTGTSSSRHLYVIELDLESTSITQLELFDQMRSRGIGVNLHYIPIHTQPYYRIMGFKFGDFPKSETYYSRAMSLPLFHGMSPQEQNTVFNALKEIFL